MLPSDVQICQLLQSQYDGVQGVFDVSAPYGIVSWALKHYPDCDVIAFEGSHDLPDWERDFKAGMIQIEGLGGVHAGFYEGLPEVLKAVTPLLSEEKPIKVCGHSLGGGEAIIFTGMLAVAGYKTLEAITFGCPFAGDEKLAALIAPFVSRSYWNDENPFNNDIVGTVPFYIPVLEPYIVPLTRLRFWSPPTPANPWGQGHRLAPHNFKDCYIPGVQNYGQSSAAA